MMNGNGVPHAVAQSSPIPTGYFSGGRIPDVSLLRPPVAHRPEPAALTVAKRWTWAPGRQFAFSWPWNFWRDLYGRR